MAKLNSHHIEYVPEEWKVEIQQSWHRVISRIQSSKAKPDLYVMLTNYMHSLAYEWNRIRKELDLGGDLRIKNPNPPRLVKKAKRIARRVENREKAVKLGERVPREKIE